MKTLRFFSRGTAMCFDLEAQDAGVRRYIGRKHDKTLGHEGKDDYGNKVMSGGWPSTSKAQEVPARGEYLMACRDGDLWAADEETAAYCGVKFDPDFGGEHPSVYAMPVKSDVEHS